MGHYRNNKNYKQSELDGLSLADHMGIRQLEVELDAKVIVGLLNSKKNPNSAYAHLRSDCRYLLGKLPQVRVSHVFREANKCTDWLANGAVQ